MKRTKIAEGIWKDASGLSGVVKARGIQRERRFPLGTSLRTIQDWRERERLAIKDQRPRAKRGTFAQDIDRYLDTLGDRPRRKKERTQQLAWWAQRFGRLRRDEIDAPMIRAALVELRETRSASTCNKYRIALSHLWHTLDGRDARNPLRDVKAFDEPEPEPRNLPPDLVTRILDAMRDNGQGLKGQRRARGSKTKARFRVMATTGLAPASIMRLTPADLHLDAQAIYVRRRQKGKGAAGGLVPIRAEAVAAFRAFIAVDAFGPWSTHSARMVWKRACVAVARQQTTTEEERRLLICARPYDLRHTFGTFLLERTGSLETTRELLQQRSLKTTKRYIRAAIPAHLRAAIERTEPAGKPADTQNATGQQGTLLDIPPGSDRVH